MAFLRVAIFTASGQYDSVYIYVLYKLEAIDLFVDDESFLNFFLFLSHLNLILSQLSRAQTVLQLIENIRDNQIL